jgi:hypothetical protein
VDLCLREIASIERDHGEVRQRAGDVLVETRRISAPEAVVRQASRPDEIPGEDFQRSFDEVDRATRGDLGRVRRIASRDFEMAMRVYVVPAQPFETSDRQVEARNRMGLSQLRSEHAETRQSRQGLRRRLEVSGPDKPAERGVELGPR